MLALELIHILRSENNGETLVSANGNKTLQRLIVKVEHIVGFVNDSEVAYLYAVFTDNLSRKLVIYIVQLRDDKVHDSLGNRAVFGELVHIYDETFISKADLV